VAGKGGAGRSSVAAALGICFAARGDNALVVEWTHPEAIAPWFGKPPAGHQAIELVPRLWAMNYSLDETLREYFVGHLGMRLLHDRVIASRHVRRLIHAAPGIAELLFCGRLFWLAELARDEVGIHYDRIVIDAPATGHGAALFELPSTLAAFDLGGLLRLESTRLARMLADPERTGAVVVALPEELAIEETLELLPRLERALGRAPLGVIVNHSVDRFVSGEESPAWLARLEASRPASSPALRGVHVELLGRKARERDLHHALAGAEAPGLGVLSMDEALLAPEADGARRIVERMARDLDGWLPR